MRRIAIINQKGGVGKTTTTVNVGMALARAGHRVLLIDLDPQAHLTLHLGQDPANGRPGVYEMLTGSATVAKVRTRIATNLWIATSSIDLAAAEVELVSVVGREVILRDLLDQHAASGAAGHYDYILMDCPPSLGVLTLNGLCAATEVFIPLQPHYLALQGLGKLLETVSLVSKRINPALVVSGVVICMNDTGTKLAAEVLDDVRSFFEEARGSSVPWSETRVFETMIRRNIKLAESPSYGQSIFQYAPDSNGAKDYEQLGREIHDPVAFTSMSEPEAAVDTEPSPTAQKHAPARPEARSAETAIPAVGKPETVPEPDPTGTAGASEPRVEQPQEVCRPDIDPALAKPAPVEAPQTADVKKQIAATKSKASRGKSRKPRKPANREPRPHQAPTHNTTSDPEEAAAPPAKPPSSPDTDASVRQTA